MTIPPIQAPIDTSNVPIEDLANNQHLTQQQKIHEASRQFEAIMLQQILSEMQKPVIDSDSTDDSTASGIYQDYITQALSQSMSKSDSFGFAKIFEDQLSPRPAHAAHAAPKVQAAPVENPSAQRAHSISAKIP
jgi:Rod binding domain-containing protein